MSDPRIHRIWAMPNAETFSVPPIGEFVRRYLHTSKVSIDPFARNKRWATYTNDLNPETQAEYHMDVLVFAKKLLAEGKSADLLIFDPPYSPTQIKMSYESIGLKNENKDFQRVGRWSDEKAIFAQILLPDSVVLSFGWNSVGMGKELGFEIEEIMLICHGGGHNDTICMAERRLPDYRGKLL